MYIWKFGSVIHCQPTAPRRLLYPGRSQRWFSRHDMVLSYELYCSGDGLDEARLKDSLMPSLFAPHFGCLPLTAPQPHLQASSSSSTIHPSVSATCFVARKRTTAVTVQTIIHMRSEWCLAGWVGLFPRVSLSGVTWRRTTRSPTVSSSCNALIDPTSTTYPSVS